ncbi:GNAT family N-acetyltransferase [Streptomyces sp. 6N223]|uniref:GNAT family N-acetyltransferase n=1 Tax=Streptomyces sp. 6N223 TaxID=3457412 RepID=UPI003FD514EA
MIQGRRLYRPGRRAADNALSASAQLREHPTHGSASCIGAGRFAIGYWLHSRWTGRGLATMAAAALVSQGFQLVGIDRIEIHHDAANLASGGVAFRLGFTEVERGQAPEGPVAPGEVGLMSSGG